MGQGGGHDDSIDGDSDEDEYMSQDRDVGLGGSRLEQN